MCETLTSCRGVRDNPKNKTTSTARRSGIPSALSLLFALGRGAAAVGSLALDIVLRS